MIKKQLEAIKQHGDNLKAIFGLKDMDAVKLCKSLRRLEVKANRIACQWCNGDITEDTFNKASKPILKKVNSILNNKDIPVFFNSDPRGYALKIDDDYIRNNNVTISRDWGGYGLIAPEIK